MPNSIFPFPIREISNSRIKLIPFNPDQHINTFFNLSSPHPEIYAHMPPGPFTTAASLQSEFHTPSTTNILSLSNPESFAFAIIDKTRPPSQEDPEGELAGTLSYIHTSPIHLSTEIGFIVILPPYQHTHVAKNAVGLACQYALDGVEKGGLGLRRLDWRASTRNEASVGLAERMGFRVNGIIPWQVRFVKGRLRGKVGNGKRLPAGSDPEDVWRDTVMLSIAWDEWESGVREEVLKVIS